MIKNITAIIPLYFILTSNAIADRLGNSTFAHGTIISIQNCEKDSVGGKPSVSIKTINGKTIKGEINTHTHLSHKCSAFKRGTKIIVGYAEGNDSGIFSNSYQIIDSIALNK